MSCRADWTGHGRRARAPHQNPSTTPLGSSHERGVPCARARGWLRRIRWKRIVVIAIVTAVCWVALDLLGWDVSEWFSEVWDTMTEISLGYLVAGLALQTTQTVFTGIGWIAILRYAYPEADIPAKSVVASYAVGVALSGWLPANIRRSSRCSCSWRSSPARRSPASSPSSSSEDLLHGGRDVRLPVPLPIRLRVVRPRVRKPHGHPAAFVLIVALGVVLLVVLGRVFWQKLKGLWLKAKVGGRVLYPRVYLGRVALPQFLGWCAKLGVTAVSSLRTGSPSRSTR